MRYYMRIWWNPEKGQWIFPRAPYRFRMGKARH